MRITTDINPSIILRTRGLGDNPAGRKHLAITVARLCDPYVPMQQGTLKGTVSIHPEGNYIKYSQPYAHYQYFGVVMGGRAPKRYTGAKITYHGAPMRGPNWDRRMLADRKRDIESDMASFLGGRPG